VQIGGVTSLRQKYADMPAIHYLNPDVQLAMAYAGPQLRDSYAALFLLDDALAEAVRATRDPMIGQIRLSWWRDQLGAMERGGVPPPEPVLQRIRQLGFPPETLRTLTRMPEGWDALLDDIPLDAAALERFGRQRGGALFGAAAMLAHGDVNAAESSGEAWALASFAVSCNDQITAERATSLARAKFDVTPASGLSLAFRPFAVLAHLARRDVTDEHRRRAAPGSPRRMLRAARFALFRK
jgi:15-cis-phytoene synthase